MPTSAQPTRRFIFGGWGAHGNACAADLIAAIVLSPDVGVYDNPVDSLFPRPEADPMYRELLRIRDAVANRPPLQHVTGLEHVFAINYENSRG